MFFLKVEPVRNLEVRHASTCARGGHSNRPVHTRSVTETEGHFAREPTAVHP